MTGAIRWYETHAPELAEQYEHLPPERALGWVADLLPQPPGLILDIGAGTGRDAAWLARQGHDVVAVEPAAAMRREGAHRHRDANLRWIADRLPALARVEALGLSFDFILLSAVWMHVRPEERARAFRKLLGLLKPRGRLALTLRHGPAPAEREMYDVSQHEIERLARDHGAIVERTIAAEDEMARRDVHWTQIALRLPDDGTGALPLLRHIILNDDKASTYKLALLRVLCRIADSAAGMARSVDDGHVAVPLGLVGLFWLRLFKPLLEANLPQNPRNQGLARVGFAKAGFRALHDVSHLDLRVSARFAEGRAKALHQALRDACATIVRMPVYYMTFPDGRSVFTARPERPGGRPADLRIDDAYLRSFGELLVPRHIWRALQRFDVWIEPAVTNEWTRLMHVYAERQDRQLDDRDIVRALQWSEPERDTRTARDRALTLLDDQQLYCVWTGKRLNARNLDIDHCFPWYAWPCEDLWNLLPAHREVNQHQKRGRLPGDRLFSQAREIIEDWWRAAYANTAVPALEQRFTTEARATLPGLSDTEATTDAVFDAAAFQRWRLKHDQQIPEWDTPRGR